jgi:hypothetical protein
MAYNQSNMLFYVTFPSFVNAIHVFSTSCAYQRSIGLIFTPYGINFCNNIMFVGSFSSNLVYILQNEAVINNGQFTGPCSAMTVITFDSFGFLSITCEVSSNFFIGNIYLYGTNGVSTGLNISFH